MLTGAVAHATWLLLGAAASTLPARAQTPAPTAQPGGTAPSAASAEPSLEDKETARSLYQQGHERFRTGDYHGALEAFSAADRIMGVPTTGLEVGRTQAKLGLLVEARDRLLKVVRYPKLPDEPEPYTRARIEAEALSREVAERIPSLLVEARTPQDSAASPPITHVKIDGVEVSADLRLVPRRLNPGPHVVQVTSKGFAAQRHNLSLQEREQRVLQLMLLPGEGGDEWPSGGDEPSGISPVAWVGFAVGGAGLLAGAITGGLTLSKESSLAEQCPNQQCPETERDALRTARTLGDASTACFIVGGIGFGIGLASLLMSLYGGDDSEDPGQARSEHAPGFELRPLVGPSTLGVEGRF